MVGMVSMKEKVLGSYSNEVSVRRWIRRVNKGLSKRKLSSWFDGSFGFGLVVEVVVVVESICSRKSLWQ